MKPRCWIAGDFTPEIAPGSEETGEVNISILGRIMRFATLANFVGLPVSQRRSGTAEVGGKAIHADV